MIKTEEKRIVLTVAREAVCLLEGPGMGGRFDMRATMLAGK